ncbi:MAG: DUF4395 domain-containing protein [Anaerolinea sp.]|nr:DUF4395 domain-containing protein [Anaerolinea sp.]
MNATTSRQIDQTGLKTGQALTIVLLLIAFVLGSPLLVAVVALCQLLGALDVPFAPYRLFYQGIVRRLNLARPNVQPDNPEPHRFAMLIGAIFNGVGALLIAVGASLPGWALVWIVIALANLNFWLSFCLGCWMYYQLQRLGVPGFTAAPINK